MPASTAVAGGALLSLQPEPKDNSDSSTGQATNRQQQIRRTSMKLRVLAAPARSD
jgi:hypothetical protein